MDIEYLLFLQNLREGAPAWFNALLTAISEFAIGKFAFLIPAVVFWCVSKEAGSYILASHGFAKALNGLVKNIFCVYRPWIRDARVQSSLMATATGYSFPSGHTTSATATYGGIGVALKRKTGKTWVLVLCLIPAVITGFARNWVGAHTPQDVVVGFALTLGVLFLTEKLFDWLRVHPEKDVWVTVVVCIGSAALLLFASLKPYPLDYAADGTLLVDPDKMTLDVFSDVGLLVGFFVAWLAERRLVRFAVEGCSTALLVARGAIGCAVGAVLYDGYGPVLAAVVPEPHLCKFAVKAAIPLWLIFVYPAIFRFVEKKFLHE